MHDDYLSAAWAAHHRSTSSTIHKLFRDFVHAMARLNARQFDAPWRRLPPATTPIAH